MANARARSSARACVPSTPMTPVLSLIWTPTRYVSYTNSRIVRKASRAFRRCLENERMMNLLVPAVLLISIVTLIIAIGTLRSSRRSEDLGEDRYELLRDQHDRLELLREERRMLTEELERESRERRQLTEYLEETDPRLVEHLERRRQALTGSEHEAERSEEEREQERRQLVKALDAEREQRLAIQQRAERLEEEGQRLQEELEQERRGHQEILRRAEGLEREQTEVSGRPARSGTAEAGAPTAGRRSREGARGALECATTGRTARAGTGTLGARASAVACRTRGPEASTRPRRIEGKPPMVAQTHPDGRPAPRRLDRVVHLPCGGLEHADVLSRTPVTSGGAVAP